MQKVIILQAIQKNQMAELKVMSNHKIVQRTLQQQKIGTWQDNENCWRVPMSNSIIRVLEKIADELIWVNAIENSNHSFKKMI
ncbi:MAG: hypothetical protein KA974_07770 [Saprospiraceae bacterium]|nr:hypothetical protein [Saprospiraceae bacterium]